MGADVPEAAVNTEELAAALTGEAHRTVGSPMAGRTNSYANSMDMRDRALQAARVLLEQQATIEAERKLADDLAVDLQLALQYTDEVDASRSLAAWRTTRGDQQ
jgi:hypothetical protein